MQPVVTAYQLHHLACPVCGEAPRAAAPVGVPAGGFGPRVQAITALCTGAYHLSNRVTQRVMPALFGLPMSLGRIANLEQATVHAVAAAVAAARAYVHRQPVASRDETGWREGAQRAWLGTAVTPGVTVFVVRRLRSDQVAQELLGERFWGGGHGSLAWVALVSPVAPAAVLGASVTRSRGDDGSRWALAGDWGSLAGAGAPDVSLVASGATGHADAGELCPLSAVDSTRGGAGLDGGQSCGIPRPEAGVGRSSSSRRPGGQSSGMRGWSPPPIPPNAPFVRRALAAAQR